MGSLKELGIGAAVVLSLGYLAYAFWPEPKAEEVLVLGEVAPAQVHEDDQVAEEARRKWDRDQVLERRAQAKSADRARDDDSGARDDDARDDASDHREDSGRAAADSPSAQVAAREVEIHLYETSWCKYCKKTRAYLDANGLSYQAHDIEEDLRAQAERDRLAPGSGVPVTAFDGIVVSGYSEKGFTRALASAIQSRLN